jgi:hypothetical protein
MPTKQRPAAPEIALTDALKFWLMAGAWPPSGVRLRGWVTLAQERRTDDAGYLRACWDQHGPALQDEASQAGFTPWCAKRVRPSGDPFTAWCQQFICEHRY